MITDRQRRLNRLILQAFNQESRALEENIRMHRQRPDVSRLSIIACLRVLSGRDQSGRTYREKSKAILAKIQAAGFAAFNGG